ncbi:MAG: AraC family transcriptional regulator [Clostridiales bacterium]|nr:AraC family transcriptional regulator [Clostridiales bacterium]
MAISISKLSMKAKGISVLLKLTLSYVILAIILTATIGFTSYYLSSSNYNKEVVKLNQQLLEQYSTTIQETIINTTDETRKKMILAVNLKTDLNILFQRKLDLGRIPTLIEELVNIVGASNDLYQGIHIYAKDNNLVLSSILGLKYLDRVNSNSWSNLIWVTQIPDMTASEVWMPKVSVSYMSIASTNVISFITTYPSNVSFEKAKGYIRFDINENYLTNILTNIDIGGKGDLFLIDNSGSIAAHSDGTSTPSTIFNKGYTSLDFFQADASNDTTMTLNNIETTVSYVSIGDHWKLVRSVPVDDFYSVSRQIAMSTIVVSIIAMILSMLIGQLFASKIYSPLKLLTSKIRYLFSPNTDNKNRINEYAIIDDALNNYNIKLSDLNKKWEDNIINLKQNLLRNIIGNTINSENDFNKRMKLVGQKNIGDKYNILLITINDTDATELLIQDRDIINNSLIDFIENRNSFEMVFVASQLTPQSIVSLIISNNTEFDDQLRAIIAFASNTLSVDVDISIGQWHESALECNTSYKQAAAAYQYRFFMPRQNMFDYTDFVYNEKADLSPLEKIYVKYSQSLISDNNDAAQVHIHSFIEYLTTADYQLNQRYECLQSMTMLLSNYSKEYYVGESDIDLTFHYMQERFSDIYDYETWLTQATYHVLELKKNQNDRKVDDIIYNIKRYIGENLANDLSLTRLSDYTTLSKSYLSHIFKNDTGITVLDYITQQRMVLAKNMIETSGLNIEQVALACGYYTPHYFSKKFKQYYGLAPRSYRAAYVEKKTIPTV